MKLGYYPKLALDGIRKNKRTYLPYILTCIGMVAMTYIIVFLQGSDSVTALTGGRTLHSILNFGIYAVAAFAAIFLFYTNSFLMRRRKKEFGLYNILGLGKKNIAVLLAWETLFVAIISIAVGLFFGISLSKLAELGLINAVHAGTTYSLSVSFKGVLMTMEIFCIIFLLIFISSLIQLNKTSALSLLKSENFGEKTPKANVFIGILGVLILGFAYYISISIKDPLTALYLFFVAVIMVIIATYLIMISTSVFVCKLLQKNKRFYYKLNNFVSVSSMTYRMKRNGAGLASICILATMVLVMISSTSALFFGSEDIINRNYPRSFGFSFGYSDRFTSDEEEQLFENKIDEMLSEYDVKKENVLEYNCASIAGMLDNGSVVYNLEEINIEEYDLSKIVMFYLIDIDDYNYVMGRNVRLGEDEVLVYGYRKDYIYDTLSFRNHNTYRVKEHLTECFDNGEMMVYATASVIVIVPDLERATIGFCDSQGNDLINRNWNYCFDVQADTKTQFSMYTKMNTMLSDIAGGKYNGSTEIDMDITRERHFNFYGKEFRKADYYSGLGGLFYLGLILSIVFMFAAVMIIYYKQVSEGYEDSTRFEIMQKVGMTKTNIRKSINSQLLIVFFLPLLFAGMHLIFAFPIIEKLLLLFNLVNRPLFILTTLVSFLIFSLFYVIVYSITSNAYYHIVSSSETANN